jgi:hypothetical protein
LTRETDEQFVEKIKLWIYGGPGTIEDKHRIFGLVSRGAAEPAIALIRDEVLEEAARAVPTTWLDPLLNGPGATKLPLDVPGVEKLCRGIAAAIRALKEAPCSSS